LTILSRRVWNKYTRSY